MADFELADAFDVVEVLSAQALGVMGATRFARFGKDFIAEGSERGLMELYLSGFVGYPSQGIERYYSAVRRDGFVLHAAIRRIRLVRCSFCGASVSWCRTRSSAISRLRFHKARIEWAKTKFCTS